MKQDIKNKEPQSRTKYVPASVKVIEVTARRVICQSGGILNMNRDDDEGDLFN